MYTTTERVWETFHVPLQQFIRRRVSDDDTAEDLLQDVFLKIHQHVETLRGCEEAGKLDLQLTRNAIIDYYRSTRPTTSLDVPETLQLPEDLPDEDVVSELFPSVRAMVTSLPAQDRQALILTEYQGLDTERARRAAWPVSIRGQVTCSASACETQATASGLLPLRVGSAGSRHRLSTTMRVLLGGSLLCRGISNANQKR